jgi:hypothetical protein
MRIRWITLPLVAAAVSLISFKELSTQPSFNGTTAGCEGSGCHSLSGSAVTARTSNLVVTVSVTGTTGKVAGELVDGTGTVVAVNNGTSSNPFTLTAPGPGTYRVNAGYLSPKREWDSTNVTVGSLASVTDETPQEFMLGQNYPNPFNPSTTIPFSLPAASEVTMRAFDLTGHEVATLIDGRMEAGKHTALFNAGGLSSGVYFIRLQSGAQRSMLKVVLTK